MTMEINTQPQESYQPPASLGGYESVDDERQRLMALAESQRHLAQARLFLAFESVIDQTPNCIESNFTKDGQREYILPMHLPNQPQAVFELVDSTAADYGKAHDRRVEVTARAFLYASDRRHRHSINFNRVYSVALSPNGREFQVTCRKDRKVNFRDGKLHSSPGRTEVLTDEDEIDMITEMILTGEPMKPKDAFRVRQDFA